MHFNKGFKPLDWLLRVLRTGFSLCSSLGVLECEREGRGSQTVVWLTQRVPDWKGGIDLGYSIFVFGLLGFWNTSFIRGPVLGVRDYLEREPEAEAVGDQYVKTI